MLVVSHEMQFVRNVSTRIVFLDGGSILEDSTPKQLLCDPQHERIGQFLRQANLE